MRCVSLVAFRNHLIWRGKQLNFLEWYRIAKPKDSVMERGRPRSRVSYRIFCWRGIIRNFYTYKHHSRTFSRDCKCWENRQISYSQKQNCWWSGSGVGESSFGVWEGGGILPLEGEYFSLEGENFCWGRENSTASPPLYETLRSKYKNARVKVQNDIHVPTSTHIYKQ